METSIKKLDGSIVFDISGRLDYRIANELQEQISKAVNMVGGRLIVDLCGAEFIDSSVLGVLVATKRLADERNTVLVLVVPEGPAKKIFTITKTDNFFTLCGSVKEAATVGN